LALAPDCGDDFVPILLNGPMLAATEPKDHRLSEISISCDGRDSVTGFREKVAAGENGGAAANWIANHLFQRDPITLGRCR